MKSSTVARAIAVVLTLTGLSCCAATFRAGVGKSDIHISPGMWPIDGFTSQHDPISVRVLLMDDGNTRIAIVVIDQTSISDSIIAKTKATTTKLTGATADNTIVVASHTFSAPHVFMAPPGGQSAGPGRPPPSPSTVTFATAIQTAVETAATEAQSSLQLATVGFGVGTSDVSVNRDAPTPRGWWLGGDAGGFSDTTLPVIRIDNMNGMPLAVLINEAVQSSVMDHSENKDGTKPVTADVAGAATRFVEQQYGGGTIAFFMIGASGDQAPIFQGNRYVVNRDGSSSRVDIHEAGFTLVDLIGERLGSETLQVSEAIQAAATPTLEVWRRSVEVSSQAGFRGLPTEPVKAYTYDPGPKIQVPIVVIRIGDIVIVGLQAELAASVGAQIKSHSPYSQTMVVTMVDGGAKYMPDAKSYDRFTYEARNSRYAQGSAEIVASAVDDLLKRMREPAGK